MKIKDFARMMLKQGQWENKINVAYTGTSPFKSPKMPRKVGPRPVLPLQPMQPTFPKQQPQ